VSELYRPPDTSSLFPASWPTSPPGQGWDPTGSTVPALKTGTRQRYPWGRW